MKTFRAKLDDIERKWYVVNAQDKPLGRLAVTVAKVLRGKNKVIYSSDVDCGDFVVVTNADKVKITGNKFHDKVYYRHSGYVGNLKKQTFREKIEKKPEEVIRLAVKGMLPKNIIGKDMLKRLKAYAGVEHPHKAQNPVELGG